MFTYCGNNPINRTDSTGRFWEVVLGITLVVGLVFSLSSCSNNKSTQNNNNSTGFSKSNANSSKKSSSSAQSSMVPSGGKTVYSGEIRICTDGSDGTKVKDKYWQKETAYSHNGKPLDAYKIPYVVIPIGDHSANLGDLACLKNHDTGKYVMCVIGEKGPSNNGWGEVSIAAIWDTGNPGHMTANDNSGLSKNYEIIIYPGVPYDWKD